MIRRRKKKKRRKRRKRRNGIVLRLLHPRAKARPANQGIIPPGMSIERAVHTRIKRNKAGIDQGRDLTMMKVIRESIRIDVMIVTTTSGPGKEEVYHLTVIALVEVGLVVIEATTRGSMIEKRKNIMIWDQI